MINSIPQLSLTDSDTIPQLGFGVVQVPPQDTAAVVDKALETGYRSIDTARAYRHEAGVGEATARSDLDPRRASLPGPLARTRWTLSGEFPVPHAAPGGVAEERQDA
jgi:hypothetical protein